MARRLLVLIILSLTVMFFAYNQNNKNGSLFGHSSKDSSLFQLDQYDPVVNANDSQKILANKKNVSSFLAHSPRTDFRKKINENAIRGRRTLNSVAIDEYQLEKPTFLEGTPWKIWIGVSAYPKKNGRPNIKPTAEVNGFYLFKDDSEPGDVNNFTLSKPLVVVDKRLDIAGVLTGVFSITLKEGISKDFLSKTEGIKILNSFPAIRTYYITSSNEVFDFQSFYNALKDEAEIESFHPEILSRQYEKN